MKRALNCEAALTGERWNGQVVESACAALEKDFAPISDMRASADMRLRVVQNLLRRFFQDYKMLEGKAVEVDEFQPSAAALPIINDALDRYSSERRRGF